MLSGDGRVVTENYRTNRPHLWGLVLLLERTLELSLELEGTTEPPTLQMGKVRDVRKSNSLYVGS